MALTLGIDTYVTVDQAYQYITEHYLSTDSLRVQWENLEEEDIEVYLRKAFAKINLLPYTGRKLYHDQTLPFPRRGWRTSDWEKVQNAQIIMAITSADLDTKTESDTIDLYRSHGLTSVKLGDVSYSFGNKASMDVHFGLPLEAYQLLRPWLSGGYSIC